MSKTPRKKDRESLSLPKVTTGIQGLDEITEGGFPRGRCAAATSESPRDCRKE
jgi:hypothetical protein